MNAATPTTAVSLLWPHGESQETTETRGMWSEYGAKDLGLDRLVSYFGSDYALNQRVQSIFLSLCQDAEVITYRQDVLEDLLHSPDLIAGFKDLQPQLIDLSSYRMTSTMRGVQIEQLAWRLSQLDLYVTCIQQLKALLIDSNIALKADGLIQLRDLAHTISTEETFQSLAAELPDMMSQLQRASSVTIGINLDSRMRPEAATLLAIHDQKFEGQTFLNRLFGDRAKQDAFQGITPLHTNKEAVGEPKLRDLLRDLDQILSGVAKDIMVKLDRYTHVKTNVLSGLSFELTFYLGSVRLINQLQDRGLPMCRPDVAPKDERTSMISDLYELGLGLRMCSKESEPDLKSILITNDVAFNDDGRIFILTGPNQGGKTTYTQATGIAQVLFQAGLYVPGSSACISPVDGIFTHFPTEEKPGLESGRFGEEAGRLSAIFQQATRHSLVLLNESLTSTSEIESFYLAQDIVRALRLMGVRAIFATHLHALAERVDEINDDTKGDSRLVSMVAEMILLGEQLEGEPESVRRTYRIRQGPPMGISYARDIAARYGISMEKIMETLEARQIIRSENS